MLFREAASAAVTTGTNSPHEWGQTGKGYLERFGNNFGTLAVHNMISYPLSVAFREDNRYVASGSNHTLSRILHAAVSPFEARRYDGTVTFSYSNVVGVIGASAMSRAWVPESFQGPTNIARNIAFTFAGEAAYNAFREFLPDLLHRH